MKSCSNKILSRRRKYKVIKVVENREGIDVCEWLCYMLFFAWILILECLLCLGWVELKYILSPTLTLALHYKLDKVLLIFSVVIVYVSGERLEKQAYGIWLWSFQKSNMWHFFAWSDLGLMWLVVIGYAHIQNKWRIRGHGCWSWNSRHFQCFETSLGSYLCVIFEASLELWDWTRLKTSFNILLVNSMPCYFF